MNAPKKADGIWWLYVLWSPTRCRTYVGITVDPERRLRQHNGEIVGGGRYTRTGRPWMPVALFGPYHGRSRATRAELSLKRKSGLAARMNWTGHRRSMHKVGPGPDHRWCHNPEQERS